MKAKLEALEEHLDSLPAVPYEEYLRLSFSMSRAKPFLFALSLMVGVSAQAVTELPKLLQSGKTLRDIDGTADGPAVYRILVPPGAASLVVSTSGGTGDCDVFTRHGAHPTDEDHDGSGISQGNEERIFHRYPRPGVWFVALRSYASFRGLKLRARVFLTAAAAATPRFSPSPGAFVGNIKVSLRSAPEKARIYYTTDGTTPTENSPRYRRPIVLGATTTLKAVAFHRGKTSLVADATYTHQPDASVPSLASGVAANHLVGNLGTMHVFKFSLPEDPEGKLRRMHVETAGGNGNTVLYLRRSAPPTTLQFDYRRNGPRNLASIDLPDAVSGDWYVGVRGISSFSGVSLIATAVVSEPDLVVWKDTLEPYVTTESFNPEECTVIEGHVLAGERRLLRFSTESRNIGGEDVVLGAPEDNPDWFEYHECHGHYHFLSFASYRLLDLDGRVAATGRKVSFCLEDIVRWSITAPEESKYTCDYQGIQAGWSDIYSSGLDGQWVDVTDVPPGDYLLEVTVNPDHLLPEGDYTNNTTTTPVSIPAP